MTEMKNTKGPERIRIACFGCLCWKFMVETQVSAGGVSPEVLK